jgi:hypothetical protein
LLLAKRKFTKSTDFFKVFLKGSQRKQKMRENTFQKEENKGRRKIPKLHSQRKIPAKREIV